MYEILKKYSYILYLQNRLLKFIDNHFFKPTLVFKNSPKDYHSNIDKNKYKEIIAQYLNIDAGDVDKKREELYNDIKTNIHLSPQESEDFYTNSNIKNWLLINYQCQLSYPKVFNYIMNYYEGQTISYCDYGCGSALQVFCLKEADNLSFSRIDLYDLKNEVSDFVEQQIENNYKNENIRHYDVTKSDKLENKYDLITCLDVLEHIVNPSETLYKLTDSLNDEGLLILTAPWEIDSATHLAEAADDFYNNGGYKFLKKNYKKLSHFNKELHINGVYRKR